MGLWDKIKKITGPIGDVVDIGGNVMDWFSAGDSSDQYKQTSAKNEAMQREFAQNSIRWKVNDAKAAGLHPG